MNVECIIFLWMLVSINGDNNLVEWKLLTNPIIFGREITLTCSVPEHVCTQSSTKKWTKGKNEEQILCLDGISINATKYNMVMHDNSRDFDLTINNVEHTDVNEFYLCSCGFHSHKENLQLENFAFIYPPMSTNFKDYSCKNQTQLFINFTILEVYPVPDCSIELNSNVLIDKANLSYEPKNGSMMFSISYASAYSSAVYETFLKISCSAEGINLYETLRNLQPCEQLGSKTGKEKYNSKIEDTIIIGSLTSITGTFIILTILRYKNI